MWKQFFVVLIVLIGCNAQNEITSQTGRGKLHHKHQLYYLTHYWVFLAIKAKIVFLIGMFLSFWMFAGKIFAFLYYFKMKDHCHCPQYHAEKIVVPETPHFEHKYSTIYSSGPIDDEDYSAGPPINFSPYGRKPPSVPHYESYPRSFKNSLFENVNTIKSIIKKVDVTELAFDAMNLTDSSCKRRFVCETNKSAERNPLIAIGLYLFSDYGLVRYKTNRVPTSIKDCFSLGPHCDTT